MFLIGKLHVLEILQEIVQVLHIYKSQYRHSSESVQEPMVRYVVRLS
jgi:hypothetical protein